MTIRDEERKHPIESVKMPSIHVNLKPMHILGYRSQVNSPKDQFRTGRDGEILEDPVENEVVASSKVVDRNYR
jgi:hypothetical protein